MKNLLFSALLLLSGVAFSQTSFVVLNSENVKLEGVSIFRNDKLLGKTGKEGRFIIPKLAAGEKLVFKQDDLMTTYVIQNRLESGSDQVIRLGSPSLDPEIKEEFGGDFPPVAVDPGPKQTSQDEVLTIVDEQAEFPGGMKAMMAFIKNNIRYPETAKDEGLQGKCYLKFIVEKDGSITNIQVLRGVPGCPECDKEAIRTVKMMPKWKPAKVQGNVVRSYFNLPFTFYLGK